MLTQRHPLCKNERTLKSDHQCAILAINEWTFHYQFWYNGSVCMVGCYKWDAKSHRRHDIVSIVFATSWPTCSPTLSLVTLVTSSLCKEQRNLLQNDFQVPYSIHLNHSIHSFIHAFMHYIKLQWTVWSDLNVDTASTTCTSDTHFYALYTKNIWRGKGH